ncbi:MAG: O-antigen ligase family protein [Xanthobacteraceae bacterium]
MPSGHRKAPFFYARLARTSARIAMAKQPMKPDCDNASTNSITQCLLLLAVACSAFIGVVVARTDLAAFAVLSAAPAIPLAFFVIAKAANGRANYGAFLSIVLICILTANLRHRSYTDKDIDLQVALRLVAIGSLLVIGTLSLGEIYRHAHKSGFLSWMLFFAYLVVTCGYASSPIPALVSVASSLGAFLFICLLCIRLGRDRAVGVVVAAAATLIVGSLVAYLAIPSLGRMSDWVGGNFVETWRLQGLFGSSNGAGMSAAAALFLAAAFHSRTGRRSRTIAAVISILALACLVLSNNRMAMASLAVSTATLFVTRRRFATRAVLVAAIGLLAASALALFADQILTSISRSGNAEEIMSATGRTRIWLVVIELWRQSPAFGYGFGSALYILPTHPDLFLAAAHAHSLYLELLFSGGIVGLGLFVSSIAITVVAGYRAKASRELALLMFFLVYGLTEPVIFGPVSFPLMIMFLSIGLILTRFSAPSAAVSGCRLVSPLA